MRPFFDAHVNCFIAGSVATVAGAPGVSLKGGTMKGTSLPGSQAPGPGELSRGSGESPWPRTDPEGRPVRFTSRDFRPRPDEYMPVLEGRSIRLEPLRDEHHESLCEIGLDPEVMRFMPLRIASREQMEDYIRAAISARESLAAMPFVIVSRSDRASPRVVGTTRFMSIEPGNRRMEIGSTWIGREWQRTRVRCRSEVPDAAARLRGARLHSRRVQDRLPEDAGSRRALLRIGAI